MDVMIIIKVYKNKKSGQWQFTVPKALADLQEWEHKDEFKLTIKNNSIILTKIEKK